MLIEESTAVREMIVEDFVFLELVVTRNNVEAFAKFECNKFNMNKQPYYVTDHNERVIDASGYIATEEELLKFLRGGLVLY